MAPARGARVYFPGHGGTLLRCTSLPTKSKFGVNGLNKLQAFPSLLLLVAYASWLCGAYYRRSGGNI